MSVIFLAKWKYYFRKKFFTFGRRKQSENNSCEACEWRGGLGESGKSLGRTFPKVYFSNQRAR
jgi:hypothetical protein